MSLKMLAYSFFVIIMLLCLLFEAGDYVFIKRPDKSQKRLYKFCNFIYCACLIGIGLVVVLSAAKRML